jgi:hypothetical protein
MPEVQSSNVKFEIGHVLFIDIVGYSKLSINEQSAQVETPKKIVLGTEQFGQAEAEGKLLRLPTGDGGALLFRNHSEAPVLCAMEISRALKAFAWLDKALAYHDAGLAEIVVENLFDKIHSDPRWLPFLRKIGKAPDQLAKINFKVTLPPQ